MGVSGDFHFKRPAGLVGKYQLFDDRRPVAIRCQLALALKPTLSQADIQVVLGTEQEKARATFCERDADQIDPVLQQIEIF